MRSIPVATLAGAILLLTALPCPVAPRLTAEVLCGCCCVQRQTLRERMKDGAAVLYGTLTRATPANPATKNGDGVTDLVIDKAVLSHPLLKGRKSLTLETFLPPGKRGKRDALVLMALYKGKLVFDGCIDVKKNSDIAAYAAGILKIGDEKPSRRLAFYADYLNHAEPEIANDALQEFTSSDYNDYRELAARLPGDRLAAWLRDPKTPAHRSGLLALLLGHCSKNKERDARLLRSLLKGPGFTGLDGVLEGLVLLQPKKGWADVCALMRKESEEFTRRYMALRTARFFKEHRPDLVSLDEVVKGMTALLEQKDIADLAIEDLRKWERWELTERVLAVPNREGFSEPIIRRAVLRFTLSSPFLAAKRFAEEQRKRDPQSVKEAIELLQAEEGK